MKIKLLLILLLCCLLSNAQSVIQTINSGSIIASNSSVSIGEIIIVPTQNQSNSGIIGILTQVSGQTLEVNQFDLTSKIRVYPNPTVSKIYFEGNVNLQGESLSIFNNAGQLVSKTKIDTSNSIDLESFSSGIYFIEFENKSIQSFKIIKH